MCNTLHVSKSATETKNLLLIVSIFTLFYFSSTNASLALPKISILSNRVTNSDNLYARVAESYNISSIDITVQKNQSVYTIPQSVVELTITCNASYPVTWNFQASQIHSQAFNLIDIRSQRRVQEVFDSTTFNYSTQIHFYSESNKLTGKYVCSSTAQSSVQSSVFIYWEGTAPQVLVHSQENKTVYWENGQAILPCVVSKADAVPQLRKEFNTTYDSMRTNKSVSYNPQIGYILNNLQFPLGVYKCVMSDSDYVLINVVLRNDSLACSAKNYNASLVYSENTNEIVCCSSSQRPPQLHVYYCNHASTCSYREHSEFAYNILSSRRRKTSHCSTISVAHYESGVVRCLGDGIDVYKEIIRPIRKIMEPWNSNKTSDAYFSWGEIEPQNMLDIASIMLRPYQGGSIIVRPSPFSLNRTEVFYSGQQQNFYCKISTYYFSEGVQWAIKWKNSTLTLFKNNHTNSNRFHFYSRSPETPLDVVLDVNIDAIVCFAPVWNSSVWVPKTKYLYVNESMTPSFLGDEMQLSKLSWTVNDTHRIITCSAKGVPIPAIQWRKDNQELKNNTNLVITSSVNGTNTSKSVLTILRVGYGAHGDYICNASNFGGSVETVFHITVIEPHSWMETILIVMAVIVVVFLLIGLILIYRKMDKDKKAIEQLSAVAFKDVATRQEAVCTDFSNSSVDNGKMSNNLLLD